MIKKNKVSPKSMPTESIPTKSSPSSESPTIKTSNTLTISKVSPKSTPEAFLNIFLLPPLSSKHSNTFNHLIQGQSKNKNFSSPPKSLKNSNPSSQTTSPSICSLTLKETKINPKNYQIRGKNLKPKHKFKNKTNYLKILKILKLKNHNLNKKKLSKKMSSNPLTFPSFSSWISKSSENKSVQDPSMPWNILFFIQLFIKKISTLSKKAITLKDVKTFKNKSLLKIFPPFIQGKLYMIMNFMNQHQKIKTLFFTESFENKFNNMELFCSQKIPQAKKKIQIWPKIKIQRVSRKIPLW